MLQQDQPINLSLKKTFANRKGDYARGTSLTNLIITSSHPYIVYSYFDALIIQSKIQFSLISIKTNTQNSEVEVIKQTLDFQPAFRTTSKDLDSIDFHIQNNKTLKDLNLVEIKLKRADNNKSMFFLFYFSLEMIIDQQSLMIRQIMARKAIKKIHWHPHQADVVICLTQDSFVVFRAEQDVQQIASISFKQLQIKQQIVDFCFWKQKSIKQNYLISGLGLSGKTYIMILKEIHQVFSLDVVKILDGFNNLSWTTINVINAEYNKRQVMLSVKSGYIYKKNKKESVMQIYQLRKDQTHAYSHQNMILQTNGKDNLSDFCFPFPTIINSSLFYFFDKKIMRLDLSKPLNYITSNEKGLLSNYDLDVQVVVNFKDSQAKFVHISDGSFITLRRRDKDLLFSSIETDILQCSSQQNLVRNKINQIVTSVEKQINKSLPVQLFDHFESLSKPAYLTEQASEASIEKFLTQVNNFVNNSEKIIAAEQQEISNLYHQINVSSAKFASLTHKKGDVQILQQQIRQNEETIRSIEEANANNHRTYEDEKAEEIQHMIQVVKERPIQVNQSIKKEYSEIISKQLQILKDIEDRLKQWEKQLI